MTNEINQSAPLDAGEPQEPGVSDHITLARWAADCAEHVLGVYTAQHPGDDRPRAAIDAGRAWAQGDLKVGLARAAAVSAHEAAKAADDPASAAAARAAGHAAAVGHMCSHAGQAADFAVASISQSDDDPAGARERQWQLERLPARLRERAFTLAREQAGAAPVGARTSTTAG